MQGGGRTLAEQLGRPSLGAGGRTGRLDEAGRRQQLPPEVRLVERLTPHLEEATQGSWRILFVDDEVNVLQGLRRMLNAMRHEWDMVFVESGQEALALLAQAPCDVIVSDMRMPGMDGTQLLTQVMERFPLTVRIILSGYADSGMILKAVGPVHQYLAKPYKEDSGTRSGNP